MALLCPCSSGLLYSSCCLPLHEGEPAPSPERLMRSRYSAFVLKLSDYLLRSWHSSTRPIQLNLEDSPDWKCLQVIQAREQGDVGFVHFRAVYKTADGWGFLEEASDFTREPPHWYYLSGKTHEGSLKPGRNDPCPCGSGRKTKVCCP